MLLFIFVSFVISIFILFCYTYKNRVCNTLTDELKEKSRTVFINSNHGNRTFSSNYHSDSNEKSDQQSNSFQTDDDFKISSCALKQDNCGSSEGHPQNLCQDSGKKRKCFRSLGRYHRQKTKAKWRYHLDDGDKITVKRSTRLQNKGCDGVDNDSNSRVFEIRKLVSPCDKNSDEVADDDFASGSSADDYFGDDEDSDEYCGKEYFCGDINYNQDCCCEGSDFCGDCKENGCENENGTFTFHEKSTSYLVVCEKRDECFAVDEDCSEANKSHSLKR